MLVAVRKHDDVASPRPVLVTVVNSDPAGAAGDDVEQDDAVGIWPEDLRCLRRGQRLVRPWLAVLGSKEYCALQSEHGRIFCLVEAPDADAAISVHREAHGPVADAIFPVAEGS